MFNPTIPKDMTNYKCITKQGHWYFQAHDHMDALRLALFYCWRDGEDFVSVQPTGGGGDFTLRAVLIGRDGSVQTL